MERFVTNVNDFQPLSSPERAPLQIFPQSQIQFRIQQIVTFYIVLHIVYRTLNIAAYLGIIMIIFYHSYFVSCSFSFNFFLTSLLNKIQSVFFRFFWHLFEKSQKTILRITLLFQLLCFSVDLFNCSVINIIEFSFIFIGNKYWA